ncbi:MAG: hypothetical protein ABIA47_02685 [bacterium]
MPEWIFGIIVALNALTAVCLVLLVILSLVQAFITLVVSTIATINSVLYHKYKSRAGRVGGYTYSKAIEIARAMERGDYDSMPDALYEIMVISATLVDHCAGEASKLPQDQLEVILEELNEALMVPRIY